MVGRVGVTENLKKAGWSPQDRKGAALVELALILPLLLFSLIAATDFARAFHDLVIVTDRARLGALYASQNVGLPGHMAQDLTWQDGIVAAVSADCAELSLTPAVMISPSALSSIPASDPYVSVTVTSPFQTVMTYPGIPSQIKLTQTIRMRLQPTVYRMK